VEKLLEQLELAHIPMLRVFNKTDIVEAANVENLCRRYDGVPICALKPESFPALLARIEQLLFPGLNCMHWDSHGKEYIPANEEQRDHVENRR
jgi:50S ribosomal subunit-associated GTPase HflX